MKQIKIKVNDAQWYPVWDIVKEDDSCGIETEIEVSAHVLAKWNKIFKEFNKMQIEIANKVKTII